MELPIARISHRITLAVLAVSLIVTLVTSALELHRDYRRAMEEIEQSFAFIGATPLNSLAESIWVIDEVQISLQLEGLSRLPGIEHLDVRVEGEAQWSIGQRRSERRMAVTFPLVRDKRGERVELGVLEVTAGLDPLHQRLADRAAAILLYTSVEVFLVAGVLLLLFNLMIGAPLRRISDYLSTLDLEGAAPSPLAIRATPLPGSGSGSGSGTDTGSRDELDHVSESINQMVTKLSHAHHELEAKVRERTAELEVEVAQRQLAERVVTKNRDSLQQLMRLNRDAVTIDEREILARALDIGVAATDSEIGYLHKVNEDQESIELVTWNEAARKLCTAAHDDHYPLSRAGVWADCARLRHPVVHNDYPGLSDKRGYPEGHFPVLRHMSVPVIQGGKVRMILGVGNKRGPYDEFDVEQLQMIADEVQKFVERRRMELALEEARNDADGANRAKSEFLATMSHEIRTPMNVVIGMADVLLESPLNSEQREQVELLRKAGGALLGLIDNVLDLSKIEADRIELSPSPLDPRRLLDEVCSVLAERARQKGVALTHRVDEALPAALLGDANRLMQILINLIGNAIKFTDRGEVEVNLEVVEGIEGGGRLRCSVRDSGIGIAPEHLDQIFDHFTQADSTISRRYGGSGLGLAISRRLVERMGGEIRVESRLGEGSRFLFTLPLIVAESPPPTPAPTPAPGEHPAAHGVHILLVEDSEDNRRLIETYLKRSDHRLETANDGEQAVERAMGRRYDLILMDIQMPVVDGYEATRRIRAWEAERNLPATPIVALTAHALQGDDEKSREAGCDGHLTKPIKKAKLLEGIARYARS